jgi:uncharacterized protein
MVSYWDTSALVPLLVRETDTALREKQLISLPGLVTWWGSRLECISALCRREREGHLDTVAFATARQRLEALSRQWTEVPPSDVVRLRAERLLRNHSLRAADSFQLAAALISANELTAGAGFYCADGRLCEAAAKEGFEVFPGAAV